MIRLSPLRRLSALVACGLLIAGCGGQSEQPQSTKVITPASTPETPETKAETPAAPAEVAQADPSPPEPAQTEPAESEPAQPAATPPEPTAPETAASETSQPASETVANQPAEQTSTGSTTFKGRVVVKGTVSPSSPIMPSGNDPYCIALGSIPREEIVMSGDGGLANVFVWLRKVPDGVEIPPPPEEPAVLDQKNCRFIPRALVAQVGQKLLVKNDDATSHNTRFNGLSVSFNNIVGPNNREGIEVDFTRSERVPIPVNCDIHGWMSCRILLVDNPWYAITDENGYFEITDLPAGELEFRLQHEKSGYVEKSLDLTIEDGQTIEKTFEVDAGKFAD